MIEMTAWVPVEALDELLAFAEGYDPATHGLWDEVFGPTLFGRPVVILDDTKGAK